jgi:hypothetical protein
VPSRPTSRAFKTAGFAKTSTKARISDEELCQAIRQVWIGQVDNIDADELLVFRLLVKSYAGLTDNQVGQLLAAGDFVEICHDDEIKIQK